MSYTEIYNAADTICAISTPQGAGAIAIVRLSGAEALAIADKVWQGKPLAEAKTHTAHLGHIVDPATSELIDQAVATIFRGPKSFTGEDTVEFALHGSRWIQQRVLNILAEAGARPALPGEYTRRAFAAGKLDLAEAEAVADLIAANSKAAHRLAMSQLRGEYSSHLNKLRDELINLASLLELELDFSEEEVEFASRERLIDLSTQLHGHLSSLAASYAAGKAIKDGFPIAIIGPTNAGKSSLLNALLGDDRAIVSDIHGTTRDIVEDTIEMGPYLVRFKDTAGLRNTDDVIERLGIERSRNAAATAGLVLYIIDSSNPPAESDIRAELAAIDPGRVIRIYNKTDLASLSNSDGIHISALTSTGLDTLRTTIINRISDLTGNHTDTDITVTNARHADALRRAADSSLAVVDALNANIPTDLVAQDLRETIHHLSSITGDITTPTILENIFKNFCVGK